MKEAERFLSAPALAELGAAVSEPPYAPNIQTLVDTLPKEQRGAALVALAVAVGSSHPRINLLPPALRPRPGGQVQRLIHAGEEDENGEEEQRAPVFPYLAPRGHQRDRQENGKEGKRRQNVGDRSHHLPVDAELSFQEGNALIELGDLAVGDGSFHLV